MIYVTALIALVPIAVLSAIWAIWRPRWMGFQGKSLWDWLALLAVPLVVGFATFLISAAQAQIERDRATEQAMQSYFARIGALVLDERLDGRTEERRALGRAETMAILRLVRGERAGRAFAFLSEMNLLHAFAVEFESIDLRGAELKSLDLDGLDFEGSDLSGADLEGASMVGADLEDADLRRADLKFADLRRVDFNGADLARADLSGANLRGTDLSAATGLSATQIRGACLDAASILPVTLAGVRWSDAGCDQKDDD